LFHLFVHKLLGAVEVEVVTRDAERPCPCGLG
jgi:hypothetical protein